MKTSVLERILRILDSNLMRKGLDKYGHHHGLLNVSRFSEHEKSCLRKLSSYSIDYS